MVRPKIISLYILFIIIVALTTKVSAQVPAFDVVPLGVKGGSDESNLSAYAIAAHGSTSFVCLDAGTLHAGIRKAIELGVWTGMPEDVLKNNIKGYLISHPHLDHLAGLVLNSPDDSSKPIYGITQCIDVIRDKYFSWNSWANFANEGEAPQLKKYTYVRLTPGTGIPLAGTGMQVTAYILSHSNPQVSTAFLIRSNDDYLLYLGDTGSDEMEKSDRLSQLWKAIGPLIRSHKLKAIFIEVSFPDAQPSNLLFGHLTPTLLMKELRLLNADAGVGLKDVNIVITHMKPGDQKEETIKREVISMNDMGFKLIFPEQGKRLEF